jgi:hypothetical protein
MVSAALVHYGHAGTGEILFRTAVYSIKLGMEEKSFGSALLAQHVFMKENYFSLNSCL